MTPALLLDTHAFLWLMMDGERVPGATRARVQATEEVYVSAATAREIRRRLERRGARRVRTRERLVTWRCESEESLGGESYPPGAPGTPTRRLLPRPAPSPPDDPALPREQRPASADSCSRRATPRR